MNKKLYLTELQLNFRSQAAINWIRNPYKVHQRLWMAMPEAVKEEQKDKDKRKIKDREAPPFLFRLEPEFIRNGRACPRILVQSQFQADWEMAFDETDKIKFLADSGIQTKTIDTNIFGKDMALQFDIVLNPTKKIKNYRLLFQEQLKEYPEKYSRRHHDLYLKGKEKLAELAKTVAKETREKLPSVRIGIYDEQNQIEWLKKQGNRSEVAENNAHSDAGFEILKVEIKNENDDLNYNDSIYRKVNHQQKAKKKNGDNVIDQDITYLTVNFSGILRVTDPEKFRQTLFNGIGRAKAFGCGLLLLKRI